MLKGSDMSLHQYRERYEHSFRFSDWLTDGASRAFLHSSDGIAGIARATKLFLFGMAAIAADTAETKKKKKRLCGILSCQPEELAIDLNELAAKRSTVKYFGGDFTYSAATPKECLQNMWLIFGNAHLEALDEMACFGNLESVWGSLYTSRCTELNGLHLKIVKGDLHGEKLVNANGLEQLKYVGGRIFFQDNQFLSLEAFRSFLKL